MFRKKKHYLEEKKGGHAPAAPPLYPPLFLKDWLLENALDEIEFPKGLVRAVFENEQVVGKRYSVKAD